MVEPKLLTTAEAHRRFKGSVFLVSAKECNGQECRQTAGTAFALQYGALGTIGVTAAHVVARDGADGVPVDEFTLFDVEHKRKIGARVLAISSQTDTALLSFDVPLTAALDLEAGELEVGLDIVSIGNDAAVPLSMGGGAVVKRGNISAIRYAPFPHMTEEGLRFAKGGPNVQWIQGNIAIVGGASGCPWLSLETGKVVGICSWGMQQTGSDNFAVGPVTIRQELDKLAGAPSQPRGIVEVSKGVQLAVDPQGTQLFVFRRSSAYGRGGLVRPPRRRSHVSAMFNPVRRFLGGHEVRPARRLDQRYFVLTRVEGKPVATMSDLIGATKGVSVGEVLQFEFAYANGSTFSWVLPAAADLVKASS